MEKTPQIEIEVPVCMGDLKKQILENYARILACNRLIVIADINKDHLVIKEARMNPPEPFGGLIRNRFGGKFQFWQFVTLEALEYYHSELGGGDFTSTVINKKGEVIVLMKKLINHSVFY